MKIQKEVFSKPFTITEYKSKTKEVIHILKESNCEVEILFGSAWGNTYKDWTPYEVPPNKIMHEIELAEQLKHGVLGDDDFYIIVKDMQTEILFCHERDIHLSYNHENKITSEILEFWKAENLINTIKTTENY